MYYPVWRALQLYSQPTQHMNTLANLKNHADHTRNSLHVTLTNWLESMMLAMSAMLKMLAMLLLVLTKSKIPRLCLQPRNKSLG
jgi:hypothetical protein